MQIRRSILHVAARETGALDQHGHHSHIAVGDVRDIADGTDNGRKQNQKLSQWAHGQFVGYLTRAPFIGAHLSDRTLARRRT